MIWILSIIRTLFVFSFLLLNFSCTTGVLKDLFKKKKVSLTRVIKKQEVFGPTMTSSTSFFQDQTSKYGLSGMSGTQIYAVDFNNDELTDIVLLPSYFAIPVFLKNTGNSFVRIEYSPFKENLRASYLLFFDYNKDGVLDVIKGTLNQKTELKPDPLQLYIGSIEQEKVFYSLKKGAFDSKPRPAASLSLIDFDLDGDLDIFVANWFKKVGKGHIPTPDELLENRDDKFINRSELLLEENVFNKDYDSYVNATPSFGVGTCDVDLNGRVDIMVSSSSGFYNKLWLNLTSKDKILFRDYSKIAGFSSDEEGRMLPRGGGNSFFSTCTDYNNDGTMDILQGELFHAYDSENRDRSSILTGSRLAFPPKFLRTEFTLDDGTDSWTQGDRRGNWFDFNFDGLIDAIVDNTGFPPKSRLLLFEQLSNHAFTDVSRDMGVNILNPTGTVLLDVNQDGKMDILTGQSNVRNSKIKPRLYLFVNQGAQNGRKAIRVYLRGHLSNPAGIGATIKVKTDQSIQTRFVEYSNGPLPSQNEEGMFFGLGKNTLNEIEVTWPYKEAKKKILKIRYKISDKRLNSFTKITLCESGQFFLQKTKCP